MGAEPALAILIIALFAGFIVWGRSAAGQETLTRVFGPPARRETRPGPSGRRRAAARPSTKKPRTAAPRASGGTTRRPAARRDRRK